MPTKQAAAAVGQCELMYTYDKLFGEYNHTVAQILLTSEDIEHDDRQITDYLAELLCTSYIKSSGVMSKSGSTNFYDNTHSENHTFLLLKLILM